MTGPSGFTLQFCVTWNVRSLPVPPKNPDQGYCQALTQVGEGFYRKDWSEQG